MSEPIKWPTREEWAKQTRTLYTDMTSDVRVSERVSDYATPAEIAIVITELEQLYRDLGRELKRAKQEFGDLCRQPGETKSAYTRRWFALPREIQDRHGWPWEFEDDRRCVRKAIKDLRQGVVPSRYGQTKRSRAPLAEIFRREVAAMQAAIAELQREVESRPIDDAAWAEEVERRARLDAHFGRANAEAP